MRSPTLLRAALIALAALIVAPGSAFATTAAWLISDANMSAGPGPAYKSVGTGATGALVAIERCTHGYCKIDFEGKVGWVALDHLSFGIDARGMWTGPHFDVKSGNGTVCLYTGADYTGDYLCRKSGFVEDDFAITGLDNLFSSVKIVGDASVLVCRDLNFTSYCETITRDTPKLNRYLDNNVSSIRVY